MLYERGWSEQEVIDLYRFIDWELTLPLELKTAFRAVDLMSFVSILDLTNWLQRKN